MLGRNFHAESRKGSQKQAIEYCKKEEKYQEWGECKKQGEVSRDSSNSLAEMVEGLNEGKTIPELINSGVIDTTNKLVQVDKLYYHLEGKRMKKPNVIFLYGGTGVGKTRSAIQTFANKLDKSETDETIFDHIYLTNGKLRGFNGYNRHRYLIIDDFRSYHQQGNNLLRLLDRYPYAVEVKGSTRQMVAEDIIITSCFDPITVFRRVEDTGNKELEQIMRRIDEIYEVKEDSVWVEKTKKMKGIIKRMVE